MFEQALIANPSRRVWSTCAGMSAQALLVLAVALVPIVRPDVLPRAQQMMSLVAPGAPTAEKPAEAPRTAPARPQAVRPFEYVSGRVTTPTRVPDRVAQFDDPPQAVSAPCYGCLPGNGQPGSSLVGQMINNVPPVAPVRVQEKPAEAPPAPPQQIRLRGGDVRLAHPVYRVEPRYPQMAIIARISGPVELEGIIAVDGHIRGLHALSGSPLLVPAAIEAVRQWVYEPTLLNGKPVEVIAPITVIFRLNR